MKNKILSFSIPVFCFSILASCYSHRNLKEYIQLNHENVMVIKGDKLSISLIPASSNRKRPVIVKTVKNNEQYDNRRITLREYHKIAELITQTKQKDIELPKSPNYIVAIIDGGSNTITLKRDTIEKKLYTTGVSKKYHGQFYKAAELILKAAKLEIHEID